MGVHLGAALAVAYEYRDLVPQYFTQQYKGASQIPTCPVEAEVFSSQKAM